MPGTEVPPCWLLGQWRPSTGTYRLFGEANGRLWEGSHQWVLPRTSADSGLDPVVSHSHPRFCRSPSDTSRLVWFSLLWSHCSFPRGLMHTLLCMCPQEWSLCFPQSFQSPAIKSHYDSKPDSLGIPSPFARPPCWEAWRVAQNLHSSEWTSVV